MYIYIALLSSYVSEFFQSITFLIDSLALILIGELYFSILIS